MTNTVATLGVVLKGDARQLDAVLAKADRELKAFEKRYGQARTIPAPSFSAPTGGGGASATLARDEAATLRFAQARAQLLRQSGDLAGAERVLQGALNATTVSTTQTIGAQRQLLTVQQQAAKGTQSLTGTLGGLNAALGAAGLGLGVSTLVRFGEESIQAANRLEDLQTSLRAIAGDAATYNRVIEAARSNQKLFGGSLADNVEDMTSFVISSRTAGVEMEGLIDISKRLAAFDPGQGLKGANIALRELLSGNTRSLQGRFELPSAALKAMGDESLTATEKLAKLDEFLNSVGITSEALNGRLENTSQSYRDLGIAVDNLKTSLGSALAEGFQPTAEGAALAAQGLNDFVTRAQGGAVALSAVQQSLVDSSGTYAEYVAAVDGVNQAHQSVGESSNFFVSALAAINPAIADSIAASITAANQTRAMSEAEFEAARGAEVQAAAQVTANAAINEAVAAAQQSTTASNSDALAKLEQAAAAEQAQLNHEALEQAILAAAASGGSAQAAAIGIAAKFNGVEAPAIANLINLYRELNAARGAAAQAKPVPNSLARFNKTYGGSAPGDVARSQQASLEAAEARRKQLLATGDAAQIAALREREYQQSVKLFGASSSEAISAQTDLIQARQRLAAEQERLNKPKGGGGKGAGGAGGTSAADKATRDAEKAALDRAEKISTIEERAREAALEAERAYQEEVLEIIKDFAEQRADASESFEQSQLDGRAGFYDDLRSIDDEGIKQRASAAFEAGELKAGELEQTQGGDVAEAYREANADVVRARAEREAEIAKLREEGKNAEAQYLADVDAMYRRAEENRLAKIAAGEDSLDDQEAEALDAAAQKRQEDLAAAQGATAEAARKAEQDTLTAVGLTNEAYQERLRLLQQIGAGGATPGGPLPPAGGAVTAPTAGEAQPLGQPAQGGGAVAVVDASVVAALDGVRAAVRSVEQAVGRVAQRSTVGGLG